MHRAERELGRIKPALTSELATSAAERVCRFAEALPHTRGRWACSIFGWLRKRDGLWRFPAIAPSLTRSCA
jgi:DNA-binding HxlR family transcriptional regulator